MTITNIQYAEQLGQLDVTVTRQDGTSYVATIREPHDVLLVDPDHSQPHPAAVAWVQKRYGMLLSLLSQ